MNPKKQYPIFDHIARARPFEMLQQMRDNDPIYKATDPDGQTIWFFSRYEDCVAALKDKRLMKNWIKNRDGRNPEDLPSPWREVELHLLNQDPPEHTRLRALVHKAFTPTRVRALKSRIQHYTSELLDQMAGNHQTDLISALAFPLPIMVISEMLGIDIENRERFRAQVRILLSSDNDAKPPVIMEIAQYMNAIIAQRRLEPQNDILSGLIHAQEEGDHLSNDELLSMILLLIVAGYETTVNLIGNGMLALLENPEQQQLLKHNPQLIKSAIEEMLRYNSPVAANHDPAIFENPEKFDITRDPNPHLAFGQGIHYCVGAPLARMEGALAINMLLSRYPNIAINADPSTLEWTDTLGMHGLRSLPVTY